MLIGREEEVAAVLARRGADVVDRSRAVELRRQEAGVGLREDPPDLAELGHPLAEEDAALGLGDRLVEAVLRHADRAEAQVELADVDRVERGLERRGAGVEDVLGADGVVLEVERAHVHLAVDDVLSQLVGVVRAVGGEEDVRVRPLHVRAPPEDGHHPGQVAVADVVLAAGRSEAALAVGLEHHVGRVDVGAVVVLGQAEGEDRTFLEQLSGARASGVVVRLPDRAEPEDRDLPRVPVGQPVEAEDLVEDGVPRGVPALVRIAAAVALGRQQDREGPLARQELDEVAVPLVASDLLGDLGLPLGLEPVDRRAEESLGRRVELGGLVVGGIEEAGGEGGGRHATSVAHTTRTVDRSVGRVIRSTPPTLMRSPDPPLEADLREVES